LATRSNSAIRYEPFCATLYTVKLSETWVGCTVVEFITTWVLAPAENCGSPEG
jgi:hypothetical protein